MYNETIEEPPLMEVRAIVVNGAAVVVEDEDEGGKAMDDMDTTWRRIMKMNSTEIPSDNLSAVEKPLVSSPFGPRKSLIEASPEGTILFTFFFFFQIFCHFQFQEGKKKLTI